jgi:hypothetical protein
LAGPGLTVVLKDFIGAFFGWFVPMGRNGIGLGDRVEINGVGGEAIEVGILRTVLLEMRNWTNTGHLTGRRNRGGRQDGGAGLGARHASIRHACAPLRDEEWLAYECISKTAG